MAAARTRTPEEERFNAERAVLGLRPLLARPQYMIPGPFRFNATITDNATTPADLTLIATFKDKRILDSYSADNPKIFGQFEAYRVSMVVNGETEAVYAALESELHFHWKTQGQDDWYEPVAESFGTKCDEYVTTGGFAKKSRIIAFREAWSVDFENDTFEIYPVTAVNSAANVTVHIDLFGGIWPSQYGRPVRSPCPPDADRARAQRQAQGLIRAQARELYGADR